MCSRPSLALIAVAAWLAVLPTFAHAQAGRAGQPLNPPYLAGMPSVDRVRSEIRGSDAIDTLARQVAVLNSLPKIVTRMRLAPGRQSDPTPDEQQLLNAYSLASYEMLQGYSKSAGPEAAKVFQQTVNRLEFDGPLSGQMFGLLSPATAAEFRRVESGANAAAKERRDQQIRENEQARNPRPAAPQAAASPGALVGNDPAVRRCVELGGIAAECIGQGLVTGLFGNLPSVVGSDLTQGLRMGGQYTAPTGLAIAFTDGTASISSCGKLIANGRRYSVARRGTQVQVEIYNDPRPLVVVLGPDGRFTGPTTFAITGPMVVGQRQVWVETRNTTTNAVVPGSGHYESEAITELRTASCGFASLRPTAPTRGDTAVSVLLGGTDSLSRRTETDEAPAGLRMVGTYAGGGLQLEFLPTSVVIDCGEAHVRRPYAVENRPDRVVVTIRNGSVPLSLTVRPDGTLAGSGAVEVAGRLLMGTTNAGPTFAPRTTQCAVGILTAK